MDKFRCKNCGGYVSVLNLLSNPPKKRFVCLKCGREMIIDDRLKETIFEVDFDNKIIKTKK